MINPQLIIADHLIFTPDDVDLTRSPLREGLKEKTYVLALSILDYPASPMVIYC